MSIMALQSLRGGPQAARGQSPTYTFRSRTIRRAIAAADLRAQSKSGSGILQERGTPGLLGAPRRSACAPLQLRTRQSPQLRRPCAAAASSEHTVGAGSVSVVLLAGGVGKRMGVRAICCDPGLKLKALEFHQAPIPKQYLDLLGAPIATYSLRTFEAMPEVGEIIVVCEPEYREVFESAHSGAVPLVFATPGVERQDSVYNGFQAIRPEAELVAIHDSARPLVTADDTRRCCQDALEVGAAVLGVPVKPTIKEVDSDGRVVKTLQRAMLWEVQTPQVIRPALLRAGFQLVSSQALEVTDDVSIIEALGEPVQVTKGAYTNIKVTTPDDMKVAEGFLDERGA